MPDNGVYAYAAYTAAAVVYAAYALSLWRRRRQVERRRAATVRAEGSGTAPGALQ